MSKINGRKQRKPRPRQAGRRVAAIGTGFVILLALFAAGVSRGSLRARVGAGARTPAPSPPQSQTPSLAKEYIYAGQRLIATEEPCSIAISPSCNTFQSSGGDETIIITAPPGCNWTCSTNDSWIVFTTPTSGSGSDVVSFEVRQNSTGAGRQGTVTIGNRTYTALQTGPSSCTVSLSPKSVTISADGGQGIVNATVTAGCAWQALSNASWVRVTSSTCGMGNGAVNYTVDPNTTGAARDATLTIGGKVFAIKQLAG